MQIFKNLMIILFLLVSFKSHAIFTIANIDETEEITRQKINYILTLKLIIWSNHLPVKLVMYDDPEKNDIISKKVLNIPFRKLEKLWNATVYNGLAYFPTFVNSEEDVIHFVQNNKGAIGFIFQKIDDTNIRVYAIFNGDSR